MSISRHKLPDGSELLKFEVEEFPRIGDIDSALILPNGHILVQQVIKILSLRHSLGKRGIENLGFRGRVVFWTVKFSIYKRSLFSWAGPR
ncbi:hypothetical protein AKJ36_02835 [candidate division MSBL1 archaeon SCGC-AAA259I07]|uniref:Uncharacterized protein n=1 Tax=candidate division MSBL1 archaeon SCGC-AAA259I07 TaxID=1698266 RepID=A0A133UJU8_9EURY|nr:hypothetical protein AKJ36_02835 [candidate division MSBL1 archaeon SCGC-AAA259I07]